MSQTPVYAFRVQKAHENQGFLAVVGGGTECFIKHLPEQALKCVE